MSPNEEMTSDTGCSSSSSPASRSCSAAALVRAFVIEAIQIIVSGATGSPVSRLRTPNAPS